MENSVSRLGTARTVAKQRYRRTSETSTGRLDPRHRVPAPVVAATPFTLSEQPAPAALTQGAECGPAPVEDSYAVVAE